MTSTAIRPALLGITEKDNILIQNSKTGDTVETEIGHIGRSYVYANWGKKKLKFDKKTGKGDLPEYNIVAFGEQQIEDYRKKQVYLSSDDLADKTRFRIPDDSKISAEDGGLLEVAEVLAVRVRFHICNQDWDGAVAIIQHAKYEHFKRLQELKLAALSNGLSAPLNLLGLAVRITNSLERCGCRTIFDLCTRDGGALMLASGIGPEYYEAIRKCLDEFGFSHRMSPLKEWKKTS